MKSKDYELLVREIYQLILDQDKVPNIAVQHDVIKQGISTKHQLDIYWEFRVGGMAHRVAVQAKNWSKRVDQGELLKFKAVLEDLPGTMGILVTTKGCQEGALDVAKKWGIKVCEFREQEAPPPIELCAGDSLRITIKSFIRVAGKHVGLHTEQERIQPQFSNVVVQADFRSAHIPVSSLFDIQTQMDHTKFYDEGQNLLTDLRALCWEMAKSLLNSDKSHANLTHDFKDPTFMETPALAVRVRAKSVSADITLLRTTREVEMRGPNVAVYILRDLIDSSIERAVVVGRHL